MKDFTTSVLGVVGVFGAMALALAALAFYAVAFEAGADKWFGWDGWWVPVIFFVSVIILRSSTNRHPGFKLASMRPVSDSGRTHG